ncbi:hypothetical protein [Psychrobacter sp. DAB_AL32B]|uniref:hypothetical protein n=1 Tax=Psychrobacter sp. DAB_AL32B TaxID=1028414 RepID=UPI000B7C7A82|nr:hypothetical protein [Psychrobacter sp. DAB_AL32B]OXL28009.1 hypothetical protein CAN34_01070 [Psychrobacter sp. DAB_AL32B]
MATQYTGLIFKVPSTVDIHKFRYDLIIKYKSGEATHQRTTGTKTKEYKNQNFNVQYKTLERQLPKGSFEQINYLIRVNGKLVKNISATPNKSKGVFREYELKTTIAGTKKDPNTIRKLLIDTTEVGWIIIDKQYSIESFLKKIYKNEPTDKEESIFRSNNSHLTGTPVLSLQPGDFVILSNTSNDKNKELAKMKKDAKAAKIEFDKVKKELEFNPERFASNADFLHDMLRKVDYVALTKDEVKNADKPSNGFNYAAIPAGISQGIITFNETNNAKVTEAYTRLVEAYEDARKTTYDKHGKPVKSKLDNPKKFNSFRQSYPKLIKDFDNAFSQSYFKYETGLTASNIRKQVRKDVIIRSSRYKGGIGAYVKNFKKLGKMTKIVEGGGNILVAVSIGDATMNVKEAYDSGDIDHIRKTVITETLKLEGGLAGGWVGGAGGAALATAVIGVGTGGVGFIVIGVVAAGFGVAGGILGSMGGEEVADLINERI